jgi:hypothetical protein
MFPEPSHRHLSGKRGLSSMRGISAYRCSGVCSKRRRFACGRRRLRARGRLLPSINATAASAAASPLERALSFKRSFPASSHRRTMSSSDNRSATGYSESSPNDYSSSAIVHLSVSTTVTPGSRPNTGRTAPKARLTPLEYPERAVLTAAAVGYYRYSIVSGRTPGWTSVANDARSRTSVIAVKDSFYVVPIGSRTYAA